MLIISNFGATGGASFLENDFGGLEYENSCPFGGRPTFVGLVESDTVDSFFLELPNFGKFLKHFLEIIFFGTEGH